MNAEWQRWCWRAGLLGAGILLAVTTLAGPLRFLAGSVTGSAAENEIRPAPCLPGSAVPIIASPHISLAEAESASYNSIPPTSGPHFGFPVAPGVYDDPVPDGLTVHAMEHGHVIIQYAHDTPSRTIERLKRLAGRYSADVVLAPYPKLPSGIALTAWGRIDLLADYDEPRVVVFVERLRGRYSHGWTQRIDCPDGA